MKVSSITASLTSRTEVLKDKEKHVISWPNRSYRLMRDTMRTSCDENKSSCRITGVVEFGLSNSVTGRFWMPERRHSNTA